ncbi:MAG TPA: helix-turn-helix transcriptional regulator [Acidimicrobiales bacterium]|jgi:transcriptional regulator with XRE-family HTH domain
MPKQLPERFGDLGAFIREQRSTARLSLRRLSELAGISNPYLSQIERGLRRPSAEILQQIAKALRISAETLYVQAGILEPGSGVADVGRQILADPDLTEDQKQALIRIYLSFRHENEAGPRHDGAGPAENGDLVADGRADTDTDTDSDSDSGSDSGTGSRGDRGRGDDLGVTATG